MKTLKIKWQRLIVEDETCPRCGSTEEELEKAVSKLEQSLAPLQIEVLYKKEELSVDEFKKNPMQSNMILLNNQPLEYWLGAETGQSRCCDVCGPTDCRTTEMDGEVYEIIPADLIIKAGLAAASELMDYQIGESCCNNQLSETPPSCCC